MRHQVRRLHIPHQRPKPTIPHLRIRTPAPSTEHIVLGQQARTFKHPLMRATGRQDRRQWGIYDIKVDFGRGTGRFEGRSTRGRTEGHGAGHGGSFGGRDFFIVSRVEIEGFVYIVHIGISVFVISGPGFTSFFELFFPVG